MEIRPYADRGALISALSNEERSILIEVLEAALPRNCSEFVVGFDSVLLVGSDVEAIEHWLKTALPKEAVRHAKEPRLLELNVRYDGADLDSISKACGLSVAEVIERHSAALYTVRMMGFSPGFPYLDGLDPQLHIDRRLSPRNRIEPGTVAIGGEHAGIYSVASPGGWHLLGSTDHVLFDTESAQGQNPDPNAVFLLRIGDRVRFNPVDAL